MESSDSLNLDLSHDDNYPLHVMNRNLPTVHTVEHYLRWEEKQKKQMSTRATRTSKRFTQYMAKGFYEQESSEESEQEESKYEGGEEEVVGEEQVEDARKPIVEAKKPDQEEQEEEETEYLEAIIEEAEEESEEAKEDEDEKEGEKEQEDDMFLTFAEEKPKEIISYVSVEKIVSVVEEEDIFDPEPIFEELLEMVMEKTEYLDVPSKLQKSLSHHKLIKAIKKKWGDVVLQQKKQYLLNCKLVEYFRKKKNMRPLRDDNPETIRKVIKKFRLNLKQLDQIRMKHENLIESLNSRILIAKSEIDELNQTSAEKLLDLRALITEYGGKSKNSTGQPLSSKVVDNVIRRIENVQSVIIKWRIDLIQLQDRVSCLSDLAVKIDKLGDGLDINVYEHLKCEANSLAEKIEDRNNELSKYRMKTNQETHSVAHCREKQFILSSQIHRSQNEYDRVRSEFLSKKNRLNSLRLERCKLRDDYNELSFNCGLLDKPKLLIDYDKTFNVKEILEKQVEKINQDNRKLEIRLEMLQDELWRVQ